jgi:hypothetical protein
LDKLAWPSDAIAAGGDRLFAFFVPADGDALADRDMYNAAHNFRGLQRFAVRFSFVIVDLRDV